MIPIHKISVLILFLISLKCEISSSQQVYLRGIVTDSARKPIETVSISLLNTSIGTYTDKYGAYTLKLPKIGNEYDILFSYVGFKTERRTIKSDRSEINLNITLTEDVTGIGEVTVQSQRDITAASIMMIPVKDIRLLPSASGSFEAILKTMPGVSSNNELTSQYSVRGGNFDENLVYVNDIEIFRPFLIRSGQQEGLSFINPDLISSVKFSSGGFSAMYGDRMSSVLDIKYRKPVSQKGSFNPGLLTNSIHYEGISRDKKLTYLIGARYKASGLMLKTLDARGNYLPVFADIQSLISYRTGNRSVLSFLSTFSSNIYNFIPRSRVSTFGSEASAYRLYVLFGGREKDRYKTWNSVLTWDYSGNNYFNHKIIISAFTTSEKESFDIRGWYSLNSLDKNMGSENFSDSLMNIGIGSSLSHARNRLSAKIYSLSYKGEKRWNNSSINWGLRVRNDNFTDKIKEWTMVDSAGYSLPVNHDNLLIESLIYSENLLSNWVYDTYLQNSNSWLLGYHRFSFNAGLRALYDSFTNEFLVSPRVSAGMEVVKDLSFYLSGGVYYQPPFYREMRFPDGSLNREAESQKSIHTVLGMNYFFSAWGRPFRLSTELYNKILSSIIPYRLDNVRILYSGENSAQGYSRGIDFHLNGEFVPGAESWISLSIMDSKLEIPSKNIGKFPSPSDQTLNMNIFFQDYLPGYPTWRAHINIAFVTGIPIISPYNDRYDQFHRLPSYRRVDLGITKILKGRNSTLT
ncbi:MAG: TonB-dependent receptor, partial [Odoribacter sp.]|nr:TonB-dependent receptor [Odoribacter sp.]